MFLRMRLTQLGSSSGLILTVYIPGGRPAIARGDLPAGVHEMEQQIN